MTREALRALSQAHGALAWASIAALVIAVAWAFRGRRSGALAASIAAALGIATFVTGAMLHMPFQVKLRQRLFLASAALGWLFERKEHAAFGALALAICGAVALWAGRMAGGVGEEAAGGAAQGLRRAGGVALAAALGFGVFALAVSIAAARRVGF